MLVAPFQQAGAFAALALALAIALLAPPMKRPLVIGLEKVVERKELWAWLLFMLMAVAGTYAAFAEKSWSRYQLLAFTAAYVSYFLYCVDAPRDRFWRKALSFCCYGFLVVPLAASFATLVQAGLTAEASYASVGMHSHVSAITDQPTFLIAVGCSAVYVCAAVYLLRSDYLRARKRSEPVEEKVEDQ